MQQVKTLLQSDIYVNKPKKIIGLKQHRAGFVELTEIGTNEGKSKSFATKALKHAQSRILCDTHSA